MRYVVRRLLKGLRTVLKELLGLLLVGGGIVSIAFGLIAGFAYHPIVTLAVVLLVTFGTCVWIEGK